MKNRKRTSSLIQGILACPKVLNFSTDELNRPILQIFALLKTFAVAGWYKIIFHFRYSFKNTQKHIQEHFQKIPTYLRITFCLNNLFLCFRKITATERAPIVKAKDPMKTSFVRSLQVEKGNIFAHFSSPIKDDIFEACAGIILCIFPCL